MKPSFVDKDKDVFEKIVVTVILLVLIVVTTIMFGTIMTQDEPSRRQTSADETERTVTVCSYDGEEIGSWSGKFDVGADIDANGDFDTVTFESEGGRVTIEGGIVVIKEGRE